MKSEKTQILSFFEFLHSIKREMRSKRMNPERASELLKICKDLPWISAPDKNYLQEAVTHASDFWKWLQTKLTSQLNFYTRLENKEQCCWNEYFETKIDHSTVNSKRAYLMTRNRVYLYITDAILSKLRIDFNSTDLQSRHFLSSKQSQVINEMN